MTLAEVPIRVEDFYLAMKQYKLFSFTDEYRTTEVRISGHKDGGIFLEIYQTDAPYDGQYIHFQNPNDAYEFVQSILEMCPNEQRMD